jgi:hypothetical protein
VIKQNASREIIRVSVYRTNLPVASSQVPFEPRRRYAGALEYNEPHRKQRALPTVMGRRSKLSAYLCHDPVYDWLRGCVREIE